MSKNNIKVVPLSKITNPYCVMIKRLLSLLLSLFVTVAVAMSQTLTPAQVTKLKSLSPTQVTQLQNSVNQTTNTTQTKKNSVDSKRDAEVDPEAKEKDKELISQKEDLIESGIKIFGHDIFRKQNLTFAPSLNLPTPSNYILAAGDELNINIWGAAEENYKVVVSPDGNIQIPNVGLIQLSGVSIKMAEGRIKAHLMQKVEGLRDGSVFINVSLGNIRSIKVNIVGEAQAPGTYTLPSLATLFNALYVAGGVNNIGSLRNIKLYRRGALVASLDVYDYLLDGKQDVDMRLEDDDMIMIEPYANMVTVVGGVKRPMTYEMLKNETLSTLISYSGGFRGDSYNATLSLARSATGRVMEMFTIDQKDYPTFALCDRDSITVGDILPVYSNKIGIYGAVWRPGNFELSPAITTLKQLIAKAEGVRTDAYMGRAQIARLRSDMTMENIPVNLGDLLTGRCEDITLVNGDSCIIFSYNDLKEQSTLRISGAVNAPGTIPYMDNITLADIIVMGRGFTEAASTARVEVARRIKNPESTVSTDLLAENFTFNIGADLSLSPESEQFKLEPFDEVFVRTSPGYSVQSAVSVRGEVLFEGEYVISRSGEKLVDLIAKAGGFTPTANIEGASLMRQKTPADFVRDESLQQMKASAQSVGDTIAVTLGRMGSYYAVGINILDAIDNPEGTSNIVLTPGDILSIPEFSNTVKISGAVNYPNTVSYVEKYKIRDYIAQAGGYNLRARRNPFIIFQNGSVSTKLTSKVRPGSEIVVIQKPPREPMNASAWISMGTSIVSMAAMVTSLIR